ncbi:MAG TPA: FAD:protein FMN transferase [Ohtaekwangia sp.]|nr:FAD:protein FMN transferase [Ohtaekwangia sp.]
MLALSAIFFFHCVFAQEPIRLAGSTMGTTYNITYFDSDARNFQKGVDSVLRLVNAAINMYDPDSDVSRFNRSPHGIRITSRYLHPVLQTALEIARLSGGAFDPTVMPLVNAWGFGPGKPQADLTPAEVDSIRRFVGYTKIVLTEDSVIKSDPRVQLDFGGIGQGYGADMVTDFLKSQGVENMLIELGGEGMACGNNIQKNAPWQIGITDPGSTYENQFFKAYVSVKNQSFTTAGNYFNFRKVNGKTYAHTIDPVAGYPVDLALLSVSVFAADCTIADAWDTALMVMGHEKAIETLRAHPELDAILMYTGPDGKLQTYITPGIEPMVILEP